MHLGIEIGGTKIQAGVGRGDGFELARFGKLFAVDKARGSAGIVDGLKTHLPPLLAEFPGIVNIGVGFGGPINARTGVALKSHQIDDWEGYDFPERFEELFGLPAVAGNDSDFAGLAEATFGAGCGQTPVFYMNIGTGIGGALVTAGRLYTGQAVGSMEIGHLRMAPAAPGEPWRTLESLGAGPALDEQARQRGHADGEALAAAAKAGDADCLRVWHDAVEQWGVALANAATLLCPQRIVIGGGVAAQGEFLLEPLRAVFCRNVIKVFAERVEIVRAEHLQENVVIGAVMVAAMGHRGGSKR